MSSYPEIIILNGTLITFDDATPDDATALAMAEGVITAVGPNAAMRDLAGPDTHVIDAQGGTVMPGFIDSHVHLFGGSVELTCLDLFGIQGGDALKAAIAPFAAANPDDRIVFAVQADYAILHDLRTPTRQELDQACPDRPFAMFAPDHHTIWANTAALELAGLLHGGETDAGSQIVMGDDGRATGELREPGAYAAILKLTRHGGRDMAGLVTGADPVPAPTRAEREKDKAAIARGMKHCAAQGITGLHCMDGNRYQLELLSEMEAEGTLLCRTAVPFHLKSYDSLDRLEQADTMRRDFSGDMVWCNHVKMFIDGVVEGRTAHMLAPYPGTDDNYGDPVFEVDHFNEACRRIDAMGMQIAVHAIGDAGIRHTIDGYEAARKANGARDLPPRRGRQVPARLPDRRSLSVARNTRQRCQGRVLDRLAGDRGRSDDKCQSSHRAVGSWAAMARPNPNPDGNSFQLYPRQRMGRVQRRPQGQACQRDDG